ncbi:MAG TPA: MCE family protein [Mycobacterium sp.]|nr:MCE family protein [Mycobacterium sp.]
MTGRRRWVRAGLAAVLAVVLTGGIVTVTGASGVGNRVHVTAYFANSNGLYPGDEVRALGVPIGKIDTIEPEPTRTKITFWFHNRYPVPADAQAVILSPALVTSRAIELTPVYTGGPVLADRAVIPEERTAVPVEWDDFRQQLERVTDTLQPTQPGGVSTLGSFINTAADNLRGQGADIRDTLIALSQAASAFGDHSLDIFGTIKNLSILVSALRSSTDLMRQLNQNLASVTGALANDADEVGNAIRDINAVVGDVERFVADNNETLSTTSDLLGSVTTALNESLGDLKQTLHLAPNALQNFMNIYQPAQGALTGALALGNFADPISFICGAVQAASRLGAEQSSKLCVQYLAPIVKNRQYNFPPLGENLFVGAAARPNEVTFSEDWMRPDHVAPQPPAAPAELPVEPAPSVSATDPADGLLGLMVPPGSGP